MDDWHIADLYNGKLGDTSGSYASNVTDGYGNSLRSSLPEHVTDLLTDRQKRLARKGGKTGVEEVKPRKKQS